MSEPICQAPSCSFCGKAKSDVEVLVAGPACYICDECVDLSFDVVAEHRERTVRPWAERLYGAVEDFYRTGGESKKSSDDLVALLVDPEANDRLRSAGEAAHRMILELRDIRIEIATAAKSKENL